ncbi:MAG: putative transcriptional regulator [Chloroflexi bacterium]|nr:putative transcriptional regulator [Chloroflexota bacterium]
MAIKHEDYIASLPQEEQQAIEQETERLIAEEMTLQALRKARLHSQKRVGEKLKVNQSEVSKIERRTDLYVSTLRHYIKAVGGELEIVARFPDRPPIRISQFKDLDESSDTHTYNEPLSEIA